MSSRIMPNKHQVQEEEEPDLSFWKNRRVLGLIGMTVAGLILLGVVVSLVVYPRISKWRQSRLINDAKTYLEHEDYRSTQLVLEQAVQIDSTNYVGRRFLADFYEKIGSGRAIEEWEALTKAEPANTANFLGLAAAALRLGRIEKVGPALAAVEAAKFSGPEYYRIAAAFALATKNQPALEDSLAALARFEPDSALTRFSFASVRLYSAKPAEVESARDVLEEFARGDPLRIRATLQLIDDAPRRWPGEKNRSQIYINLANRILESHSSTSGVMSRLGRGGEPGLRQLIEHMKAQPAPDPTDAATLDQWLLRVGLGREGQLWMESLPESRRRTPVVLGALADCAAQLADWDKLEEAIQQGAWGRVPHDVIQLAFSVRVLRMRVNAASASEVWANAVTLSASSLTGLRAMQRLAQLWQWPELQAQALWAMTRQFPSEKSAWQILAAQALAAANSDQLWRVYSGWAQAAPGDPQVQAEFLMIALLLRPFDSGLPARAAELFRQNPDNLICRIAQALALWRINRAAEGLALLKDFPIAYADEPRFALVNGLLLSAVGRGDESEQMLALAATAKLLPAELMLHNQARARNRTQPPVSK